MSENAYVYILSKNRGNVLYIGSTTQPMKRIETHKRRLVLGFTRKYNVHRLIYYEVHPDIETARRRERALKGKTRAKKEALIDSVNPMRVEMKIGSFRGDPSLRSG